MSRKRTRSLVALIPIAVIAAVVAFLPNWDNSPAPLPVVPPSAPAIATPTPTSAESAAPTPTAPTTPANEFTAAAAVAAALPLVDVGQEIPPYRRSSFGTAWTDIDGNGCRQRDDVLARDLVDVVLAENSCTVLSGVLEHDPYTGQRIIFQHDRIAEPGNRGSQGVQTEHIFSLYAAFIGGAWAWTPERRLEFANTLENLIAVQGSANESKGEDGPAKWLPPVETGYLCTYVLKYTQIAQTWGLAVDVADRDALVHTLTVCGDPS